MLRKQFLRRRKEIWIYLLIVFFVFVAMHVVFFLPTFEDDRSIATTVAVLSACFGGSIMHLVCNVVSLQIEYDLLVGMGQKRIVVTVSNAVFLFLEIIIMAAELVLLSMMMPQICRLFGITMENVTIRYFLYTPIVALVIVILELFAGSLYMRFGQKILYVFWAIYMLLAGYLHKTIDWYTQNETLRQRVTPTMLGVLGAVILVILGAISWRILRKWQVL